MSYHLHANPLGPATSQSQKLHCLTRLEVATRENPSCAFWCEPRAAFYTENRGEMQNKNVHSSTAVRKNFQTKRPPDETHLKKNWKSGEYLT
jgi:hypothetical protein